MTGTHEVPPTPCPSCAKNLDAATGVGHRRRPGVRSSVGVCAYCAELLVFNEAGVVHAASPCELADMPVTVRAQLGRMREQVLLAQRAKQ